MALYKKTLDAVKTLDAEIIAATKEFETEKAKVMETYKDPSTYLQPIRDKYTKRVADGKKVFNETMHANFAEVRKKINEYVTTPVPADFAGTMEVVIVTGKAITDYEVKAFTEKYKENYLAFRTLVELMHQQGKATDILIRYPDSIVKEMENIERMLQRWSQDYKSNDYMTGLWKNDTNPLTELETYTEEFLQGNFILDEEEAAIVSALKTR